MTQPSTKKESEFSKFIRSTGPEKKEAMLKIAREAAEEQKKVMESSPNSK